MRALVKTRITVVSGMFMLVFFIASCAQTTYVYQNGTTFNDYEVATNSRIKNGTKRPKIHYSKAPNWKKISSRYRYN